MIENNIDKKDVALIVHGLDIRVYACKRYIAITWY